jgi:hypothetical protein
VGNRRQFLQSGMTLALLPALPCVRTLAPPGSAETAGRPERFIFDNRFAEARSMAAQMAERGIPLAETSGDLTDLWFHDLDLQWREAPKFLAGITTHQNLFVLETLAADWRMAVVHRVEHSVRHESLGETLSIWAIAPRKVRA